MSLFAKIKKYSLIAVAASFIIGLLFLIFPAQCIDFMSLAVGFALIFFGVVGIFDYIVKKNSMFSLYLGIVVTICGIIICVKYKQILSVMVAILGIFLLTTGIVNFVTSIKVVVSSFVSGWLTMFMSIATCVLGIIAITKSSSTTVGIVQLMGVALIVYAVIDIVIYIQLKRAVKRATQDVNGLEIEGEIVESEEE